MPTVTKRTQGMLCNPLVPKLNEKHMATNLSRMAAALHIRSSLCTCTHADQRGCEAPECEKPRTHPTPTLSDSECLIDPTCLRQYIVFVFPVSKVRIDEVSGVRREEATANVSPLCRVCLHSNDYESKIIDHSQDAGRTSSYCV